MPSETRARFDELLTDEAVRGTQVTMVGVGSVGSWATLALMKMGFSVVVWDEDEVGEENVGTQLYGFGQIGMKKVDALKTLAFLTTDVAVVGTTFLDTRPSNLFTNSINLRVGESDRFPRSVLFVAVDSMDTRKELWEGSKRDRKMWNEEKAKLLPGAYPHFSYTLSPTLWVDVRVGAKYGEVHVIQMDKEDEQEQYERTLYSDAEASVEPCRARMFLPTSMMAVSLATHAIKSFAMGEAYPTWCAVDLDSYMSFGLDGVKKTGN